ncbi:hypothetical protein GMOD_00001535 [Pyrenophora seminiperda CCB06]|uniref:Uncharacterized protein n=1 Tax=Pyrenophora seminiperda CCB06 TaxID=1302712 RepID=A0A3M7LZF6_9PLEO|nr:hypothetical protein GMOD_00001535 [Pyrenophora seminiperda CCB06]
MDDVVAYNRFGKNAHVFEQSNGGEVVVHGEDFGSWARRRTQEMRAVKEARIRQHGKETPIILIPETRQHVIPYTWRPGRIKATTIPAAPYSKPTDTTLPTTSSDIAAHAALVYVLCPSKFFVAYCRRRKIPPFQHVEGFDWFGEYTWQWHRNMSGCWVLGYGDDSCKNDCALPCDCGCNGSFIDRCYCNEFNVGTWQEEAAPEEQQRCSLVEWANGELREKMEADEEILQEQLRRGEEEDAEMQRRMDEHGESWEANFSGDEFECEWGHYWEDEYVILESEESEASESWSVVSGVEQRRFADFTGGGSSAEQWMD